MILYAAGSVIVLAMLAQSGGALAQTPSATSAPGPADYAALVQTGTVQLQTGKADLALASGEAAIKLSVDRWEGYALAGGALMNLKRYEEAADKLSAAILRAPEAKQPSLRDLRRQSLLAESGTSPAQKDPAAASTTQSEIVLWKSLENTADPEDVRAYLRQYPTGAFAELARSRIERLEIQARTRQELQKQEGLRHGSALMKTFWLGESREVNANGNPHGSYTTELVFFDDTGKFNLWSWNFSGKLRERLEAELASDAKNLSIGDFIASSHLKGRGSADGTWTMDDRGLELHYHGKEKDECDMTAVGHRAGDSIQLELRYLRSGGFFGCQDYMMKSDLHLIGDRK